MTLTLIGSGVEILGLAVAAYGLFLTWRGVAEGHPLIPLRHKRNYTGHAAVGMATLTGSAYGYVTGTNEDVDAKLARVHEVLAALDTRITAEARDRNAAISQLAGDLRAERRRDDSDRKSDARGDTRVAAAGLALAALGAVLQIVGSLLA
ncbi:hypothetical protein ACNPNP_00010 [Microbacterium sp. AGC85]